MNDGFVKTSSTLKFVSLRDYRHYFFLCELCACERLKIEKYKNKAIYFAPRQHT